MKQLMIAVRGAGEMATGIAHRLFASGFTRIIMSEISKPIAVRRKVAFCEAVYEGEMVVEGARAELLDDPARLTAVWERQAIGILVDEEGAYLRDLKPDVIIDAIMAKRQKPSMKGMAPLTIGVGPGFRAPDLVDVVVESNRGHNLGRTIYEGEAEAYTGQPGVMAGYTRERVLRSPHAGMVRPVRAIGEVVDKGNVVLFVDQTPVDAKISGVLRGLIRPIQVANDEKVGDVDPRGEASYCWTISEKAHAIAGGVLEAIMHRFNVVRR